MSWTVDGQVYHSKAEYEKALARQRERQLRQAMEQLSIPTLDTSRLEGEIAMAEARNHAIHRLAEQVRRGIAEQRERIQAHSQRIGDTFQEIAREADRLEKDLKVWADDFNDHLRALVARDQEEAKKIEAQLDRELEADRQEAEMAQRRRADLLAKAEEILDRLDTGRLRDLGLEATSSQALLVRARQEEEVAGLDLARKAYEEARGLESKAAYREARLAAMRGVYKMEIESLREALRFSPEDRADLVGALDAPLQRELDHLLARLEEIRFYEDHELRLADLGKALDPVAARVTELASQVRGFDGLEKERLDLVRNRLGAKLQEILGEDIRLVEVTPGELGLQPVEARFQTARGEKVDCSVYIDGTLRIHHYEHANQATCAASALKLTKSLPELMALNGQPRLDVATAASPAGTTETKGADAQTKQGGLG